jgi:hypothetical protein
VTCVTAAVPRLIGPLLLIRLGRSSENLFADVLELSIRHLLDRCELFRATGGSGDRDAGAWAIGARHRDPFRDENGRLLYRRRPGERLRKDYAVLRRAVCRRQPIIMCARSCAPTVYEELALLPQLT